MYYGKNKRREEVVFSRELRDETEKIVQEMHQLLKRGYTPKVKYNKSCKSCSLAELCLPRIQENRSVSAYIKDNLALREGEDEV